MNFPVPVIAAGAAWVAVALSASEPIIATNSVGEWAVTALAASAWLITLAAITIRRPIHLVVIRCLVPLSAVVGTIGLVWGEHSDVARPLAFAVGSIVASALVFLPSVGDWHINARSYGSEHWFTLRTPAAMLIIAPALWALSTTPTIGALSLLRAAERGQDVVLPVALGLLAGLGWFWCSRSFAPLVRRALVSVPAGFTIVDEYVVADPVLLPRGQTQYIGPAPADTDGLNLTGNAVGLVMLVALDPPVAVSVLDRPGGTAEIIDARNVLVAPVRPDAVMALAQQSS